MKSISLKFAALAFVAAICVFFACSKKSNDGTTQGTLFNCASNPLVLTASVSPATLGQANGSINAQATGGVGAVTYSIDGTNFANTGVFGGLDVGVYTVTARTPNGCTGTLRVTVPAGNPCTGLNIAVTATTTASSGGSANGSITASATGGNAPYTYSRDGGTTFQSSATFSTLAAGNYTIIAKDVNGCTGSASVTVN